MSGVWLMPDRIEEDYRRFAAQIQNMYQVSSCYVYKHRERQKLWFGYQIKLGDRVLILRMMYTFNSLGELQPSTEGWQVLHNNEPFLGYFWTLGDVFNRFDINRR